jgi:hypothetical protein
VKKGTDEKGDRRKRGHEKGDRLLFLLMEKVACPLFQDREERSNLIKRMSLRGAKRRGNLIIEKQRTLSYSFK